MLVFLKKFLFYAYFIFISIFLNMRFQDADRDTHSFYKSCPSLDFFLPESWLRRFVLFFVIKEQNS